MSSRKHQLIKIPTVLAIARVVRTTVVGALGDRNGTVRHAACTTHARP